MKKYLVLLFCGLYLSGCGLIDAVDAVNATPDKLDKTNEAVRLQKVALAKQGLEDPENARVLLPVPFGMMGYAKLFAENATNEELAGQIYLYLKLINEGEGVPFYEIGDDPEAELNYDKYRMLVAASAIAGFIPQYKIQELEAYVYGEDRYIETVFNIYMLRFKFLTDTMLRASLFSKSFVGSGEARDSIEYIEQMEWILNRPYASSIGYSVTGLADIGFPESELNVELMKNGQGKTSLLEMVATAKSRATDLQSSLSLKSGTQVNSARITAELARLNAIENRIK